MEVPKSLKIPAIAAATAAGGLGIGLLAGGGGGHEAVTPAAASANVNPLNPNQAADEAQKVCDVAAYPLDGYQANIGGDLIANIGDDVNGNLQLNSDTVKLSQNVAKLIAPNNAGLSVVSTILSAEKGITPAQVATQAGDTLAQMNNNPTIRRQICQQVVARVLATPAEKDFRSGTTGLVAVYSPAYEGDSLAGIDAKTTQNTETQKVFTLVPAANTKDEALAQDISNSWGINAEGQVIQKANKQGEEGNAHVTTHGKQVRVKQGGKVTVHVAHRPSHEQLHGGGGSDHGGGTTNPGSSPERLSGQNRGNNAGPNRGNNHHAHTGPNRSPNGGVGGRSGGTPHTVTVHTAPPPVHTETQTQTQTQTQTETQTQTQTQTTPTQTTPTTPEQPPKGSEPGCVPKPPYVVCKVRMVEDENGNIKPQAYALTR